MSNVIKSPTLILRPRRCSLDLRIHGELSDNVGIMDIPCVTETDPMYVMKRWAKTKDLKTAPMNGKILLWWVGNWIGRAGPRSLENRLRRRMCIRGSDMLKM